MTANIAPGRLVVSRHSLANLDIPFWARSAGISDTMVLDCEPVHHVGRIQVGVSITHPCRGQLGITLTSPSGRTALLKLVDLTDERADVIGVFPHSLVAPCDLDSAFRGDHVRGAWSLEVADILGVDGAAPGRLNGWSLTIEAAAGPRVAIAGHRPRARAAPGLSAS